MSLNKAIKYFHKELIDLQYGRYKAGPNITVKEYEQWLMGVIHGLTIAKKLEKAVKKQGC